MKIVVAAALILVVATFILNTVIRQRISRQLQSLSPSIQLTYSSIHSNILKASVSFDNLEISFIPYKTLPGSSHTFQFVHASIKDINFFKLLFSKKFSADGIYLGKGNILIDSLLFAKKDSAQAEIFEQLKTPFKSVNIRHLEFSGMKIRNKESLTGPPLLTGDFAMQGIQVDKQAPDSNQFHFTTIDCDLADLNYSLPNDNGILHIGRFVIDGKKDILHADSLRITQPGNHENPNTIEADIPFLEITKPDLVNLLQKRIIAEQISIPAGKIKINNVGKLQSPATDLPVSIHVKKFEADKLAVMYSEPVQTVNFTAVIHIDEAIYNDSFSYAALQCNLSAVRYTNRNSHHNIEADNAEVDTKKSIIKIDGLKIIPQYSKYDFDRKLGHQADRVDGRISRIEILKPDFTRIFQNKLVAEKIIIAESNISIFRDRRLPRLEKNLPLPVAYLKTIPADIRVKTCVLASSMVEYEEYPEEGFGKTGVLRLEKIRVTLSPFINHPVATDPDHMTMNVTASIMGSGTAQASVVMPFGKDQPYHITGEIDNLDLTKLNSSSENLGKIRIKSGLLDFLSFDFVMTNERSTGKIVGAYHGLVIQQLKKHTDEKNVADFASFMLRHLIIPLNKDKSLPEKKRTGNVNYMRDPTRFVSHYFLQSLLMGVKKSFTLGFLLPK